jgi:enterochelin esterase-like enzyme
MGDAPLLVVAHDGPDYDRQAGLGDFLSTADVDLVLLPAEDRLESYSASPAYAKRLTSSILPPLARGRPVVGVGASLGALALLHAQRRAPSAFAGLFLQSGSFFQPRFDSQESGFERYRRITRFTGRVLGAGSFRRPIPVTITCGADEENLANNRSMAGCLRGQGYDVTFAVGEGGHDWNTWRAAFDPHLTDLLRRVGP